MTLALEQVDCRHWNEAGIIMGGHCGKGLHGGYPSRGVCNQVCDQREPDDGLSIERARRRIAIVKPVCESCKHCREFRGENISPVVVCGQEKCETCAGRVSMVVGKCPLDVWDSSNLNRPPVILKDPPKRTRLIIRHEQGLGDACCFSAALRDLHIAFPNKYDVELRTWATELFQHNPYIKTLRNDVKDDPGQNIDESRVEVYTNGYGDHLPHMLHGFHKRMSAVIGVNVPVTEVGGDIRLSDVEKDFVPPWGDGPYWVVNAGSKPDFTVKQCDPAEIEKVIAHFKDRITFVQIGGKDHYHPPLRGAYDFRGNPDDNSPRKALIAMYRADGVITPISFPMHLAAALETPKNMPRRRACIVLAGGRETPTFVQYPCHTVLHTIGKLDCCMSGGCWRYKVDEDCMNPVKDGALHLARCMTMLKAERIIEEIESRYHNGRLRIPLEVIAAGAFDEAKLADGTIDDHDASAIALMAVQNRAKIGLIFDAQRGRTALMLARCGIKELYCVGKFKDQAEREDFYHNVKATDAVLETIEMDSVCEGKELRTRLRRFLGDRKLDFALLDGDRSKESVLADIETATTFTHAGAIVCGTNYHLPDVQKAVDECFARQIKITGRSTYWVRM